MGDHSLDDPVTLPQTLTGGGAAAAGPSDPGKKPTKTWEAQMFPYPYPNRYDPRRDNTTVMSSRNPWEGGDVIRIDHPFSGQPKKMARRREMERLADTGGYSLDDVIHHSENEARLHVLTRHAREQELSTPWGEDEYYLHRRHYKRELQDLDRRKHLQYIDDILAGPSDDIPRTSALKYIESTEEGGQLKRDDAEFFKGKKMRISVKNPFVLDLDFANLSLS